MPSSRKLPSKVLFLVTLLISLSLGSSACSKKTPPLVMRIPSTPIKRPPPSLVEIREDAIVNGSRDRKPTECPKQFAFCARGSAAVAIWTSISRLKRYAGQCWRLAGEKQ